jgi:hypothetical protein
MRCPSYLTRRFSSIHNCIDRPLYFVFALLEMRFIAYVISAEHREISSVLTGGQKVETEVLGVNF